MANDSKMKLELLLKGKDQLSAIIKKQSPLLKQLDRDALKAYKSLTKLFDLKPKANFSGFSKGFTAESRKITAEAAKLKKTLESIGNLKIKTPKIATPSYVSDGLPKANPKKGGEELDKIYGKKRKPTNYVQKLANFNNRVLEPAAQIKDVWKGQISSLQDYTEETKKLLLAQSKFKLIGLSEADNKKAFEAVAKVVRETGNVTRTEGIETLTDLHTAMGNLDHAIEALPNASKYRFSMKTLFADKFSDSEIEDQVRSAYKVLELTGKTLKGQKEMNDAFNTMTRISNATGGRITPADFMTMGKTGKTAFQNLTSEGMMNMSAVMQSFGAPTAGTAMMSLFQSLVGGQMRQPSAQAFFDLGLADPKKIEYGKGQKVKKLMPGANKLGDLMMSDPLSAADMLREAMKKHGINTDKQKDVDTELGLLFQNRNAQALMSFLINKRQQVTKEADLARNAQDGDKMYGEMDKQLKDLQKVENAWKDLKAKAGLPLIETFGKLAEAVTPLLSFFAEHENLTQWTLKAALAAKAVKLFSDTASVLSGSGLGNFFSSSAGKAEVLAGTVGNAATKTGKLKGVLQNLGGSSMFKFAVATVGVEAAILAAETLIQHFDEIDERQKKVADDAKSIAQQYDRLAGLKLLYNAPGDYKGQEKEFDVSAKQFIDTIKEGRTLETSLHPERASWWEHYKNLTELPYGTYDQTGGQFNPAVASQRWKAEGLTASLHDPNVLARIILQTEKGGVDEKGNPTFNTGDIKLLLKTYENIAGKQKFQAATEIAHNGKSDEKTTTGASPQKTPFFQLPPLQTAANEQAKLAEKSGALNQSFLNLVQPTASVADKLLGLNTNSGNASGSVLQLGNAAASVASRFSGLQINIPTFGFSSNPLITFGKNPNILRFGQPTKPPTFGFSSKPLTFSPPTVFSGGSPNVKHFGGGREKGGSVTKHNEYRINEVGQEYFTPNQSGSIVSNSDLRNAGNRRGSGSNTQNVTFSPTINLYSDKPEDAMKAIKVLEREMARIKSDLADATDSRRTARRVAGEVERDAGRS